MYRDKFIAAVVPVYNEEVLIRTVIDTMPGFVDKIIVIDDHSTDRTAQAIREIEAGQPGRVVAIRHEANQGVGGAIASGYKWCRDNNADVAVVMAGDAQMDPADLPALLEPIVSGRADYAKGNRLFSGDAWRQIPRIRYLGNSAMSLLTKIVSGYWRVADSQCGYTAANREVLTTIDWERMYKRYGQPNDLLVRLNVYSFRVCDVKVKPVYNIGEKSGVKPIRMIPKLSALLLRLFFYRMWEKYILRDFHPLIFFYSTGALLLGLCIPLTLRAGTLWWLEGILPAINTLAVMLCAIMGMQLTLFAMWFDMEYNRHLNIT